jgi:hypothetical protein
MRIRTVSSSNAEFVLDKDSVGFDKACDVIAFSVMGCCPASDVATSQRMVAGCTEVAGNAKAKTGLLFCESITRIHVAGV